MSVTDIGERYYQFCQCFLVELHQEERTLTRSNVEAAGKLRVLAGKSFGALSLTIADISMRSLGPIPLGMDISTRTSS